MLKHLLLKPLALWRTQQSRRMPYVTLQTHHVENLKTIVDRETLLEHLPMHGEVAEVGVLTGQFSRLILEKNQPSRLHLIDTWEGKGGQKNMEQVTARFSREIASGLVILHRGRSTEVLEQLPDDSFDWIYLDTDHAYDTTASELALSAKKLKSNGLIVGHDYITGNWDGGVRYGVVEAVNQFCVQHDWEFVFLTAETHRHLSFGIKRRSVR